MWITVCFSYSYTYFAILQDDGPEQNGVSSLSPDESVEDLVIRTTLRDAMI